MSFPPPAKMTTSHHGDLYYDASDLCHSLKEIQLSWSGTEKINLKDSFLLNLIQIQVQIQLMLSHTPMS